MPPVPDDQVALCAGCGGKNPVGSTECDWCGRPFISKRNRLRLTLWQVFSSLLLLAVIGAIAALAYLNAGRPLPPVRALAATSTPPETVVPTPVVTPRVTAANAPTATNLPTSAPTPSPESTPQPTPTPPPQVARIANTGGLGVSVRLQPGSQAPRAGVLREGIRVILTGNDQTVAARPWREVETEDHSLKGWVMGDFLQLVSAT